MGRFLVPCVCLYAAVVGAAERCAVFEDAEAVSVASSTLRLSLDDRGRVKRLRTSAGVELLNDGFPQGLFRLEATRTNDFTVTKSLDAGAARKVAVTRVAEGADAVFTGFAAEDPVEEVTCRIRGKSGDRRLRFGIETRMRAGWALTQADYPRLLVVPKIGHSSEDDAFASGHVNNRLVRNPASPSVSPWFRAKFPNSAATQFLTFYDDLAGFVLAAEDEDGLAKEFAYNRGPRGFLYFVSSFSFETGTSVRPYDVTLVGLSGTPENPLAWQDAADVYREWASGRKWCSTSVADRRDLPVWMKDAPAMAMFKTSWFDNPEQIHRWVREYWAKMFAGTPLLASLWGWEGRGEWIGTDYFPCHPSDEGFVSITKEMREHGIHPYPWPSGYFWTLTYDKRPDGTFAFDDRGRFANVGAGHVVCDRDGRMRKWSLDWIKGGEAVQLCGGDPWTIPWVSTEIVRELAKRGCDVVQGDQLNGGVHADCWCRDHLHAPGAGRWKVEAARAQLVAAREAIAAERPEGGVVTYEEANETLDDLAGVQLVRFRRRRPTDEQANLYAYVNHGAIPMFYANPPRSDYDLLASAVTMGLMPRLVPSTCDYDIGAPVLPTNFFASVREVSTTGTNRFHYGENANGADSLFRTGRTYRISADFETLARAGGARLSLDWGLYTSSLKSLGGGHIPFPEPGTGVRRLSGDFTVKDGQSTLFRVMLNASGDTHGRISNLKLEIVGPDGRTRPACFEGEAAYDRFMRRWIDLYRGEARDFLANGRCVKPPRISCAVQESLDSAPGHPAVRVGAFTTWDGRRKALVFVNATRRPQRVTWVDGTERTCELAPFDIEVLAGGDQRPCRPRRSQGECSMDRSR